MFVQERVSKRKKAWVVNPLAVKKQWYLPFENSGQRYEFDFVVTGNSLYYIDVLIDYTRVMRFKVKLND